MSQPSDPSLSSQVLLVTPCLDEAGQLDNLLGRFLAQAGDEALFVVADGGSTDGSQEIVERWAARDSRVRLMRNPARIQSAGVNRAARRFAARRRWMVRIDAHADYPPDFVSKLVETAERTGADSVVVSLNTRGETFFQRATASAMNSWLGTGGSAHRVGAPAAWVDHGHHALIDLNSFLGVGGYDASFSHNEDAEFDTRLRAEGGRIWLTDEVAVTYHPRRSPSALLRQYFNYGKGRARTILKHRSRPKLRQTLPLAVAPAVALAAFGAIAGAPILDAPAALWSVACLASSALLFARDRRAESLAAGPVAMLMHLGWSAGFWKQLADHVTSPLRAKSGRATAPAVGEIAPA
jgi:succinoglycan biosynthesis protein ExoA